MQKTLVHIIAQVSENYSQGGFNWMPKGIKVFTLTTDAELFLYDKDVCIKVISKMLEEMSNRSLKFEYLVHELIDHPTEELDLTRFENLFNVFAQVKYKLPN